jgi:hypothetical protein
MDGDFAPLQQYAPRRGLDRGQAPSVGIYGERGSGLIEETGIGTLYCLYQHCRRGSESLEPLWPDRRGRSDLAQRLARSFFDSHAASGGGRLDASWTSSKPSRTTQPRAIPRSLLARPASRCQIS